MIIFADWKHIGPHRAPQVDRATEVAQPVCRLRWSHCCPPRSRSLQNPLANEFDPDATEAFAENLPGADINTFLGETSSEGNF